LAKPWPSIWPLSQEFSLTSVDLKPEALAELAAAGIKTIQRNLSQPETISEIVRDYDLVINAVPVT